MSAPYYADELVTLHHAPAEDTALWADGAVMLVDPPYGIAWQSGRPRRGGSMDRIVGDDDTSVRDAMLDAWGDRPALVFGSWRRTRPTGTRALLVWDNGGALGSGDLSLPWKPSHQEIYVLGRGFHGYRGTDVLRCPPVQAVGRLHPHQKPTALLDALLTKCPPGTVVDPTAGSGSLGVVAKQHGRRCVLVESEEAICEVAAERLRRVAVTSSLFDVAPAPVRGGRRGPKYDDPAVQAEWERLAVDDSAVGS